MTMKGLNQLEQSVLDMLLEGDHPALVGLRAQAAEARLASHENTGVGFFCEFSVSPAARGSIEPSDFELNDVDAQIDGLEHGAGFILFVRDGVLDLLEGYSYDEPWPAEITDFELTYRQRPRVIDLRSD